MKEAERGMRQLFWFCAFCRRPVAASELANHRCTPMHVMQRGEEA